MLAGAWCHPCHRVYTTKCICDHVKACTHLAGLTRQLFWIKHLTLAATVMLAFTSRSNSDVPGPVRPSLHASCLCTCGKAQAKSSECLPCWVLLCRSGWRNNPALPEGLVYQGLWGNEPQQLYGETGAQSTIVPAFDAVLGIKHQEGW